MRTTKKCRLRSRNIKGTQIVNKNQWAKSKNCPVFSKKILIQFFFQFLTVFHSPLRDSLQLITKITNLTQTYILLIFYVFMSFVSMKKFETRWRLTTSKSAKPATNHSASTYGSTKTAITSKTSQSVPLQTRLD